MKRGDSPFFCTLDKVDVEAAVERSLMLADGEASDADRESWRRPVRTPRIRLSALRDQAVIAITTAHLLLLF